jgi:hypothetical protein
VQEGLGPGDSSDLDYPVAGAALLTLGILVFHFFPHPVKKPRDAISIPDGGL